MEINFSKVKISLTLSGRQSNILKYFEQKVDIGIIMIIQKGLSGATRLMAA